MPQEWETGMVINIHKKGTKSKCENYRGITLLPTAYKLFVNIIKDRKNPQHAFLRRGSKAVGLVSWI